MQETTASNFFVKILRLHRIWKINSLLSFRLNSRYGIIGTPTILLWVDGSVVSRMDELEYMPAVENKSDFIENIRKILQVKFRLVSCCVMVFFCHKYCLFLHEFKVRASFLGNISHKLLSSK
ncbi:unnamed protein product [Brugia timori]|uniref:Thioredoxin-like_fold domain-containing protein n=1 Tax=Brugia timori TaxID=42155 RepID=A0A0R3QCS0_9BILA|nr:unnamed protein product [Brugia timori]